MSADQKYDHDNQALSLQVESLQAQIQEQAKLAKEQVQCMGGQFKDFTWIYNFGAGFPQKVSPKILNSGF